MTIYHIPGTEDNFDDVYIVLTTDNKGEGILSMQTPEGPMPFIFGNKEMINTIMPDLLDIAIKTGNTLQICKFKKKKVLKEIKG